VELLISSLNVRPRVQPTCHKSDLSSAQSVDAELIGERVANPTTRRGFER
jgi:hypothetical protein